MLHFKIICYPSQGNFRSHTQVHLIVHAHSYIMERGTQTNSHSISGKLPWGGLEVEMVGCYMSLQIRLLIDSTSGA